VSERLPAPLSVVCRAAGVSRSAACEQRRRRDTSEPLRRRPGPIGAETTHHERDSCSDSVAALLAMRIIIGLNRTKRRRPTTRSSHVMYGIRGELLVRLNGAQPRPAFSSNSSPCVSSSRRTPWNEGPSYERFRRRDGLSGIRARYTAPRMDTGLWTVQTSTPFRRSARAASEANHGEPVTGGTS
jgi:hypothetical protein